MMDKMLGRRLIVGGNMVHAFLQVGKRGWRPYGHLSCLPAFPLPHCDVFLKLAHGFLMRHPQSGLDLSQAHVDGLDEGDLLIDVAVQNVLYDPGSRAARSLGIGFEALGEADGNSGRYRHGTRGFLDHVYLVFSCTQFYIGPDECAIVRNPIIPVAQGRRRH
jgi:hypothetical protein